MSSSWFLRHSTSPLTARVRACASPFSPLCVLPSPLSPSSWYSSAPRLRFAVNSSSPLLPRRFVVPVGRAFVHGKATPVLTIQLKRFYSPRGNPWQSGDDWKSTLKAGGLVLLGTGAFIVSTSLAFGLLITGAAGFGAYTLYRRLIGQYRSRIGSRDPFSNVNSNINALNDMFSRSRRRSKSTVQDDLDSLVQGLPLVVRGLVKTAFSFLGKAMQSSMERAGELRRRTDEYLQANKRVRDQMGDNVSVGGPEQWMESTVNGTGRIEAVFPIYGGYGYAHVTMKTSIGKGGNLNITELKYRNRQTGDVIDLLHDPSVGDRQKTVIDAEYVDVDNKNTRSRW